MEITYVNQPLDGADRRLGDHLNGLLRQLQPPFERMLVAVAFAKSSGVSRIAEGLEYFRARGGNVQAIVGISRRGTSKQALEALMGLCDRVIIFHNPGYTFHPKFYLFDSHSVAIALVGSGNLTGGGLYTNYEHSLKLDLDLTRTVDANIRNRLVAVWDGLAASPTRIARNLDRSLFEELVARNHLIDEAVERGADETTEVQAEIGVGREPDEEEQGAPIFSPFPVAAAPPIPRASIARPGRPSPAPVRAQRERRQEEVLFAEIPRAATRWNQANFDQRNFIDFFHADTPGNLRLWHVSGVGRVAREAEIRPGVTVRSRNFRIELGAAAGLAYPANGRPIAVFVRRAPREFHYMLLLPGSAHYQQAENILARYARSRPGRMRRERIPRATAAREWPESPLWRVSAAHA